jgi:GntR family transcriptional regulator / MocR family aminotransferase
MRTLITVDQNASTPLTQQVYNAWRHGILQQRFFGGQRVPSSRELAQSLGIARSTVTTAYEQLIAEGYLVTKQGAGTFVCSNLPMHNLPKRRATLATRSRALAPAIPLSDFGRQLQSDNHIRPQPKGWIDFSHWDPDLTQFPFALWKQLLQQQLRRLGGSNNPLLLDYSSHAAGYWPLRCEVAKYLARTRAVVCKPEQVLITNGSQQGLDLTARVLLNANDKVLIENPCYSGARQVFAATGAKLLPAAIDEQGLRCDYSGKDVRLLFVTPSHQFPLGVSMSLARRLELLHYAKQRNTVIVEDDYDSEFRYHGPPLPALQGLSDDVAIVYCGTFSKVMFPALRIGYLVVPDSLVPVLTQAKWLADRYTPLLEQAALTEFMAAGHLERHVRRMRKLYGARREALVTAFQQHFGAAAVISGIDAGMHALVQLKDNMLLARAEQAKVKLRPAAQSYLGKAPPHQYLFGFSSLSERVIKEGIKRIG